MIISSESELHGDLRGDQMFALLQRCVAMIKAVLKFGLNVTREAIAQSQVQLNHVVIPSLLTTGAVANASKDLLVPTSCDIQSRSDLISGLEVISQHIGIPNVGNFKSSQKHLAPKLPMVPSVADVIIEGDFVVIIKALSRRQERFGLGIEIGTDAERNPMIPRSEEHTSEL